MEVRKLTCPSCGAQVEVPVDLSRAHCVYCGSEILISSEAEAQKAARQADLEVSLELLRTAVKAQNWSDILRYADRVLEVDPNTSYAWYWKGLATCNSSTWTADLWEEGRTYLDKALEIDPENQEARIVPEWWPGSYIRYLCAISKEQWKIAYNVWAAECLRSFGSIARRKAAPYAARALATLDKALSLLPQMPAGPSRDKAESTILLKKVEFLRDFVTGPQFGDPAPFRRRLEELRAKGRIWEDVEKLPDLRQSLEETEAEIARIEKEGGFLRRRSLGKVRKEREEYLQRIRRAEELLRSEGPPARSKGDAEGDPSAG